MKLLISILPFLLGFVCSYEEQNYNNGYPTLVDTNGNSEAVQRYARSPIPKPFVSRPNRGGSGPIFPPGVNPTFPKNGGQWPEAYKSHRFPRSPQLHLIKRDEKLFPRPSPTFPNPPRLPTRYARSPRMSFVDRPTRGGHVIGLPPGVNPTFPKNGGQWPAPRYARSPIVRDPHNDLSSNKGRPVLRSPSKIITSPTIPENGAEVTW